MAPREQAVAIAVIGISGSGKSTFINLASGSNLPGRKSLGICTTELESSTFSLDGRTVTLIDTPGFDDKNPSVLEVLKMISNSLPRLFSQGTKLAGVIYMHSAAENPTGGPSRHNFRTFCKFCGDTTLRDVVIVTNTRSGENSDDGDAREQESAHKDECFGNAVDKGAQLLHHDGSQGSAHTILRRLIHREPTMPPPVEDASFHRRTDLACPSTCTDSVRELTEKVEHHTKAFGEICRGIDAATLAEDEGIKEVLHEEAKNSLEEIERIRHDLERMVTKFATDNSRLEDENRRFKDAVSTQRTESEHNTWLLGEERRARKLAEAERGRVEAQLAEERALWEREKLEKEGPQTHATHKYGRRFAYGAVIFALTVCASRFMFEGSATFLL